MAVVTTRYPSVHFEGPVFIGRDVRFEVREGFGRIIVGPWCHFGEGVRVRCHEGTLRIGPKSVLASGVTVNAWLDIDIGASCLLGEGVYVCDFDHRLDDLTKPIKDQGIVKSPVHIADDVWLGTKATVTRGTLMGRGSVLAANSVAKGDYPPFAVIGGTPGRVVRYRDPVADRERRAAAGREPRLRHDVRAVILDGSGRILLCRLDGALADPPGRPWACPGGVPLPGESDVAALSRLVREQTGLEVLPASGPGPGSSMGAGGVLSGDLGEPLWTEEVIAPMDRWDGKLECYHRLVVREAPPSGEPWPARAEREQEPRWWAAQDMPAGMVTPSWLPQRVAALH